MSLTSPRSTPPWMAAPMATTSSGLTPLEGFLPKNPSTVSCTLGMRVIPPTSSTSFSSDFFTPESFRHVLHGVNVRSTSFSTSDSNFALVRRTFKCLGPEASAVMKGRDISVELSPSSSLLAFSAASRRRCMASASLLRSRPDSFLNSDSRKRSSSSSKSSPPSMVSPLVAFTSNTPPLISKMEISKVPPPRSNTRMFFIVPPLSSP
mmetsp:Transcript_17782/g.35712  ORF Transcript_17782/g.35712 Transcript_17782/m.35712 type:complete len:207 (-) Transcript_17782:541-1161(-)